MTTLAVYAVLFLMLTLGALAVALAIGSARIDRVELPDDGLEAAHDDLNGAW